MATAGTWIRDPNPVVVKIAKPKSRPSSGEEEITINEGFLEKDETDSAIKIRDEAFPVSGMIRVSQDGSIFSAVISRDQADLSCK